MVLSALQRFLRSMMVKLRSRLAFHVQFNAAAGLRLQAVPAHHHRQPSCLISWTHSGPDDGRATFDGARFDEIGGA